MKNALSRGDTRPEIKFKSPAFNPFEHISAKEYKQQAIEDSKTVAEEIYNKEPKNYRPEPAKTVFRSDFKPDFLEKTSFVGADGKKTEPMTRTQFDESLKISKPETDANISFEEKKTVSVNEISVDIAVDEKADKPIVTLIGEAFSTYIEPRWAKVYI